MNTTYMHRNFLFIGFPFFYIGFLFNRLRTSINVQPCIISTITSSGLLLLLFESWFNFNNEHNNGGFDNYLSLIIICPALFLWIINLDLTTPIKNLALVSSAIYFIHPFFILLLKKVTELGHTHISLLTILLSAFSSYILIKMNYRFKFIL